MNYDRHVQDLESIIEQQLMKIKDAQAKIKKRDIVIKDMILSIKNLNETLAEVDRLLSKD